ASADHRSRRRRPLRDGAPRRAREALHGRALLVRGRRQAYGLPALREPPWRDAVRPLPVLGYAFRGARLIKGFLGDNPIHAIVQFSNRCNLTCGFCTFWENPARREDEMPALDFEVVSAKLAEAGSMIVSIEGGEPLLRPDIVDIARAFARHHHPILFTNG